MKFLYVKHWRLLCLIVIVTHVFTALITLTDHCQLPAPVSFVFVPRMVFALILQGFGVSLISTFGVLTSILHCLKFRRLKRKTIFDEILLMCIVFSVVSINL